MDGALIDYDQPLILHYDSTLVQFQFHALKHFLYVLPWELLDLCTNERLQGAWVVEIEDGDLEFIYIQEDMLLMPVLFRKLVNVIDDILHRLSMWSLVEEDFIVISCIHKWHDKIVRSGIFVYSDLFLLVGVNGNERLHMLDFRDGVEDKIFPLSLGELVGVHDFFEEVGVGDDAIGP